MRYNVNIKLNISSLNVDRHDLLNQSKKVVTRRILYFHRPGHLSILPLQNIFESIISSYIKDKVGVAEDFLNESLALSLKANLSNLFTDGLLRLAGTGQNTVDHNRLVRGDIIYWLDRKHENEFENRFFDLIDDFIVYLNQSCYAGINDYEFHYTLYPTGTFYKRHLDRFKNTDTRKFSIIMYLNVGWKLEDGGQLRIFHDTYEQDIAPTNGKMVFFNSGELEHEVLVTNTARLSITGWLKSYPLR